jgi:hypothetical protein
MEPLDKPTLPDPATISNNNLALRYAGISAGAGILITLIGFLTNTDPALPSTGTGIKVLYSLLSFGVAIWAIASAIKEDRDKLLGGFISMGRGIGLSGKIGIVSGLASAVFMLLYTTVINPGFKETMNAAMMAEYEKQGLNEEQIEMAMGMASNFTSPTSMAVFSVIGGVISALIIGLIASAILKRDPMDRK